MQPIDVLTLQRIQGIGNKTLIKLIHFCSAKKIESLTELESIDLSLLFKSKRVSNILSQIFLEGLLAKMYSESQAFLNEYKLAKIDVILYGSDYYPKQLNALDDPPAILFCRGNLNLLKTYKSIAVVGTRKNTRLGEVITQRTVEHFTNQKFCIVSGLALGIDAIAHRAALANKGTTVAVLVDVLNILPSQNRALADQILDNDGLLISENPPNTTVIPALFIKRDRIQSGLAMAVFAIETSANGGTMHAVKAANEMNRPVFVPDSIAAKYPDINEPAIEGTQILVVEGKATAYSKESYEIITKELTALAESHCAHINGQGSLL